MKKKLLQLFWMGTIYSFLAVLLQCLFLNAVFAVNSSAQIKSVKDVFIEVEFNNDKLSHVFQELENQTSYIFVYDKKDKFLGKVFTIEKQNITVEQLLLRISRDVNLTFKQVNNNISVLQNNNPDSKSYIEVIIQTRNITGKVTSQDDDEGLPGVNVLERGTTNGTVTDVQGAFSLDVSEGAVLVFSSVGYVREEVVVGSRSVVDLVMSSDIQQLEELVVVGYGTMKKSDLTGSVVRADIESFRESPNVSVMQSLQGSVPGLSVGQVNRSGQEPDVLIRGKSSLSGELAPLIVVDNVIFRGNLIDLNPNDIESIDILKDASSAAIYGSQASNGVILITTTKSGGVEGKPTFSYSGYYSLQNPVKELRPGGPDDYIKKTEESDIFNSRTAQSGYLEKNPNWDPSSKFKTSEEIAAYNQGRSTDWYSLLTNDNMSIQNHNISLSNRTRYSNYLISLGFTEQIGYMLNEDYSRLNARINIDNTINDWLQVGIQSFMTVSDYSGQDASPQHRYLSPYATAHDENGERVLITGGNTVNPLSQAEADDLDKRNNFFGNIYANIDIPFIEGLSYKINLANNYRTTSNYYFRSYASNFEGQGSKTENIGYDWTTDNIVSFKRNIKNIHNIDVTLVYGFERRKHNFTQAIASVFSTPELGYNRLQTGNADLQQALSGAWEEASLYNMGRIFYGYNNKYLITGTIRRDGFSGFSEANKFGLFPSMSVAWVASEEAFINERFNWLDQLKIRLSYGSIGNRTIGRYATLARVAGGYNYITASGSPIYTQSISSLASPNLKWETTTGINFGIDFGILSQKIFGSIDYYNNNTKDLLYEVDIPGISRFETFPDNLGKLHNQGLEISLSSVNIKNSDFEWNSTLIFSRNRNKLKELLGFDLDGDGKEDDLISEGLFIGQPLSSIYTYSVDGKWQVNDEIPPGYDLGSNKIVDLNKDQEIDANDKSIIGYRDPSYRVGINNSMRYNNWSFKFFISSIQGGKNYYMAEDDLLALQIMNQENHFNNIFPAGLDYWTPDNPNAKYQRPNINVSDGLAGTMFSQRNFIRLQDVSLSYNLPFNKIEKVGIQNLKLYLSGKNLITLTKWPGWDPEIGEKITRTGVPVMKSYTLGMNVEF